jgi:hypothetical protein
LFIYLENVRTLVQNIVLSNLIVSLYNSKHFVFHQVFSVLVYSSKIIFHDLDKHPTNLTIIKKEVNSCMNSMSFRWLNNLENILQNFKNFCLLYKTYNRLFLRDIFLMVQICYYVFMIVGFSYYYSFIQLCYVG